MLFADLPSRHATGDILKSGKIGGHLQANTAKCLPCRQSLFNICFSPTASLFQPNKPDLGAPISETEELLAIVANQLVWKHVSLSPSVSDDFVHEVARI